MKTTVEQRQQMGCGYETAISGAEPWSPSNVFVLWPADDEPTVCPGYTTRLPEVLEAARARIHWQKGAIELACGGEPPSEQLVALVEQLEVAFCSVQALAQREREAMRT
jgi:hypothetical protein